MPLITPGLAFALVQRVNLEQGWQFSEADCRTLAEAVLPWLNAAASEDENTLRLMVYHYAQEGALVEALRAGDTSLTLSQVVENWRGYMLSVAQTRFHLAPDLAEDIVQDSWIDLLRALRGYKFHFRCRVKTYLYSLVIHRGLNMLRRQPNETETTDELTSTETAEDANGELRDLVMRAIDAYCTSRRDTKIGPQTKKQLAYLVLFGDESVHDAAARLGLNYNAAMTAFRRIRQFLQVSSELSGYEPQHEPHTSEGTPPDAS